MRTLILLLATVVLPLISLAQSDFNSGTYELADGTKGKGQLKYDFKPNFNSKLLVKDDTADIDSKEARKGKSYSPEQVRSFDIGSDHYITVHNLIIETGVPMMSTRTLRADFVKPIEMGKLELMELPVIGAYSSYDRNAASGRSSTVYKTGFYVLRRQGEGKAAMPPFGGERYIAFLTDYLMGRPDLIRLLTKRPLSNEELRALIKDYNSKY